MNQSKSEALNTTAFISYLLDAYVVRAIKYFTGVPVLPIAQFSLSLFSKKSAFIVEHSVYAVNNTPYRTS